MRTPHHPTSIRTLLVLQSRKAAVQGFTEEDDEKNYPLHHEHGCIGQLMRALQQATAGANASQQNGDRNDGQWIIAGHKGHENTGIPIIGIEGVIGPAMDGCYLHHARQSTGRSSHETNDQDQTPDRQPCDLSRSNVAPGDLGRKAKDSMVHEKPCDDTSHDPEHQSPMEICSRNDADHIGFSDMMRRGMIEAFRIAKGAGDEMVQRSNGDIVQQQTTDSFIDGAIVPQCSPNGKP
jgi:hypothetical protein